MFCLRILFLLVLISSAAAQGLSSFITTWELSYSEEPATFDNAILECERKEGVLAVFADSDATGRGISMLQSYLSKLHSVIF